MLTKAQKKHNEQVQANIKTIGAIARRLRQEQPGLELSPSLKEARRLFDNGIRS